MPPTPQSLLDHLRAAHREWDVAGITGWHELSVGWESELFAFTLEAGAPPVRRSLVVRLYQGPDGGPRGEHEFRGMRLLRDAGYPVPEVLEVETDSGVLGKPFMIMERIDGEPAWDRVLGSDGPLLDDFVGLLCRLHDLDPVPFSVLVPEHAPADPITAQLAAWRDSLARLSLDEFEPAMSWAEQHAGDVAREAPAVVHLDFHPENVLLDAKGSMTVIDWTQVGVTDPRFDLAWTLLLAGTHAGPQWRDRILERYEARRGRVADLAFFEATAATKRLVSVVASWIVGPEALGMRPGADEIMKTQRGAIRAVYGIFTDRTGVRLPVAERLLDP